jgi:hypothetical protein
MLTLKRICKPLEQISKKHIQKLFNNQESDHTVQALELLLLFGDALALAALLFGDDFAFALAALAFALGPAFARPLGRGMLARLAR